MVINYYSALPRTTFYCTVRLCTTQHYRDYTRDCPGRRFWNLNFATPSASYGSLFKSFTIVLVFLSSKGYWFRAVVFRLLSPQANKNQPCGWGSPTPAILLCVALHYVQHACIPYYTTRDGEFRRVSWRRTLDSRLRLPLGELWFSIQILYDRANFSIFQRVLVYRGGFQANIPSG